MQNLLKKKLIFLVILAVLLVYFHTQSENWLFLTRRKKTFKELQSQFEKFFEDVSSSTQEPSAISIETLNRCLQDVDEYDSALVDFVRGLIKAPARGKPLNLTEKNRTDFSQIGQSRFIDNVLDGKRNGFFIEAGAHDGEHVSNSLFFEIERNWTGLLVEAIPFIYEKLLEKNRNTFTLNACLAEKRPLVAKFRLANSLSGIEEKMSDKHKKRVNLETNSTAFSFIPCFSLNTILKALDVSHVDYFSLDVEGSEWSIIRSIDFKQLNISSFSIEVSSNDHASIIFDYFSKQLNYTAFPKDSPEYHQDVYFYKLSRNNNQTATTSL